MIVALKSWVDDQRWDDVGAYLAAPHAFLVRSSVRSELAEEWKYVAELESRLEDALLIGLVGGTGVGKSTLINALAAAEISRSGDRRPTTDRVVVYMHRDAELPADVPTENISVPHVIHRRLALVKVVLLDFPDFDSADVSHAEILRRFLPHLDVLLVVVDEMKYGDRRLYEVLSTLDIDASNVFLVLNKLDRLIDRYGDRAPAVSREILADLRQNTRQHARLAVPDSQEFALSSALALRARMGNDASDTSLGTLPAETGDFASLFQRIESFQQAKRRRLAKEKNIDVRKAQVLEVLAKEGLSDSNRRMLAELNQIVGSAEKELSAILGTIPSALFSDGDRRAWRQPRLRAAARRWGIPISLVLTLFAEIARWRGIARETRVQYLPRVERHYRSYLDAAKNLQRRFDAEHWGEEWAVDPEATVLAAVDADASWNYALGQAVTPLTSEPLTQRYRWRWLGHLPALTVIVVLLTKQIMATEQPGELGWFRWIWNGVGMLSPLFLWNLAIAMILTYVATGAVAWLREVQRLDQDVAEAEERIRTAVRDRGRAEVDSVHRQLAGLQEEFHQLQRLTEARPHAESS